MIANRYVQSAGAASVFVQHRSFCNPLTSARHCAHQVQATELDMHPPQIVGQRQPASDMKVHQTCQRYGMPKAHQECIFRSGGQRLSC